MIKLLVAITLIAGVISVVNWNKEWPKEYAPAGYDEWKSGRAKVWNHYETNPKHKHFGYRNAWWN